MIQQRKKDFLQRLIEEFFAKFHELIKSSTHLPLSEKRELLNEGFNFFYTNLDINQSDDAETLIRKIEDFNLLEHYSKLMLFRYEFTDIKEPGLLDVALEIVNYLEVADKTYSWDRSVLKEDLLRLLDESDHQI